MRKCVYMLLDKGFEVKVIGHSLGAGVAALLVADLKNGLFRRQQLRTSLKNDPSSIDSFDENELLSDSKFIYLGLDHENVHVQGMNILEDEAKELPVVRAFCYATPPCVGENLATALLDDNLVISMINGDDIVPRLSGRNIQNLADEIKSFASTAEIWMKEDEARIKRYAKTVGKEGRMRDGGSNFTSSSAADDTVPEKFLSLVNISEEGEMSAEQTVSIDLPRRYLNAESELPIADEDQVEPAERIRLTSGISTPEIMVVPGLIAHFTKPRGVYQVDFCDHRVSELSKISLLRDSLDEHHVSAHIRALRSFKLARNSVARLEPPIWQKAYDEVTQKWATCGVCLSDPTWPFITNSDASRALVYHNCRACGKIVCVMCAPAGDSVPASGVGEYQTLSDHTIPLPSLGILNPERVCLPCYLHCYEH